MSDGEPAVFRDSPLHQRKANDAQTPSRNAKAMPPKTGAEATASPSTTVRSRRQTATAIPDDLLQGTLRRILAVAFSATFSVAMVAPVLGELVEDDFFDGDGSKASLFVAAVGGGSAFLEFLTNPLLGAASDQWGRKPVLLFSLMGTFLALAVLGAYPSKGTFVAAGVLRGLTSVSGAMLFTMVSDVSEAVQQDTKHITKNTGFMLGAAAVGLVLGPGAGGALSVVSLQATVIGSAIMQLVALICAYCILPETLGTSVPFSFRRHNSFGSLKLLCSSKPLVLLSTVLVLGTSVNGVYLQVPFYSETKFSWEALQVGGLLVIGGISIIVVQAGGAKFLVPRWGGPNRTLLIAYPVGVLQFILLGLAPSGWMWFVIIPATSLFYLQAPAVRALLANHVSADSQGRLQGGISALTTLTSAVAPLAASGMFIVSENVGDLDDSEGVNNNGKFSLGFGIVLFYGAALCLLALLVSVLYVQLKARTEPPPSPTPPRTTPLVVITEHAATLPATDLTPKGSPKPL